MSHLGVPAKDSRLGERCVIALRIWSHASVTAIEAVAMRLLGRFLRAVGEADTPEESLKAMYGTAECRLGIKS